MNHSKSFGSTVYVLWFDIVSAIGDILGKQIQSIFQKRRKCRIRILLHCRKLFGFDISPTKCLHNVFMYVPHIIWMHIGFVVFHYFSFPALCLRTSTYDTKFSKTVQRFSKCDKNFPNIHWRPQNMIQSQIHWWPLKYEPNTLKANQRTLKPLETRTQL